MAVIFDDEMVPHRVAPIKYRGRLYHMTYLDKLHENLCEQNAFSMTQPEGWDNKKTKTRKRSVPRGKFFRRFERMERERTGNELTPEIAGIAQMMEML